MARINWGQLLQRRRSGPAAPQTGATPTPRPPAPPAPDVAATKVLRARELPVSELLTGVPPGTTLLPTQAPAPPPEPTAPPEPTVTPAPAPPPPAPRPTPASPPSRVRWGTSTRRE
ncbi:hypothetical protein JY651_43540 [Pyxidicoccus parkwayensis]|uniref:Uncharacterized protein n=1 Tax=Pyxidicoccus parkwayensis TaxID=2813578 RepID=A0ABX7NTA5_9BACT|nr:hypothetical protein [Pyxidicoccus parkwaysis]QSQ21948.1 hypothetical protein JY651_43540 [Pyxidicoccus parkwaysis]